MIRYRLPLTLSLLVASSSFAAGPLSYADLPFFSIYPDYLTSQLYATLPFDAHHFCTAAPGPVRTALARELGVAPGQLEQQLDRLTFDAHAFVVQPLPAGKKTYNVALHAWMKRVLATHHDFNVKVPMGVFNLEGLASGTAARDIPFNTLRQVQVYYHGNRYSPNNACLHLTAANGVASFWLLAVPQGKPYVWCSLYLLVNPLLALSLAQGLPSSREELFDRLAFAVASEPAAQPAVDAWVATVLELDAQPLIQLPAGSPAGGAAIKAPSSKPAKGVVHAAPNVPALRARLTRLREQFEDLQQAIQAAATPADESEDDD